MTADWSVDFAREACGIVRQLAGEILEAEPTMFEEDNVEAIHELRVGVNKLRVALALFHGLAPKKFSRQLQNDLAWFKDGLAPLRDADVILDLVRHGLGDPPYPQDGNGIHAVAEALAAERGERLEALRCLAREARFAQMKKDLETLRQKMRTRKDKAADANGAEDPERHDERLARNLAQLMQPLVEKFEKRRQRLAESFDPLAMHHLRIGAKKFRYALDFFEDFRHDLYPALSQSLHDLHDCIGNMHDIDVLSPKVETLWAHWKMTQPAEDTARLESGIEWMLFRLYVMRRELMRQFYGLWAQLASEAFQSGCQAIGEWETAAAPTADANE